MKVRGKWKKTLALLVSMAMLLGMMPDLTLTAVKAAAEGNAAESTQTVTFEGIDGTSGCGYGEGYESLFDGKYTESDGTKWCCDFSDSAYVIIKASEPVWIGGYTFVTGNDNARERGRNPKTWKLYGCEAYRSEDEDNSWTEIASVTGDTTMQDKNYTSYPFSVDGNETKYQYYKFEFTANQGADVMQLSEILFDYNVCDHEWVNGETQAATCTKDGFQKKSCKNCKREITTIIPAAHRWGAIGQTKEATCTEGELQEEKCLACEETRWVSKSGGAPALGHDWEETGTEAHTCTENGKIIRTCIRCHAVDEKDDPDDPATGHDFGTDGKCTQCDAAKSDYLTPTTPKGEGTKESPYEIESVGNLYWYVAKCQKWPDVICAKLTKDITVNYNLIDRLTEEDYENDNHKFFSWTAIGDSLSETMVFDGDGHTISGLYCCSQDQNDVGFFASISSRATVKNLRIADSYFYSKGGNVGGIIASSRNTFVVNCSFQGIVNGNKYVGGIAGEAGLSTDNAYIHNCYTQCQVMGSDKRKKGTVLGKENGVNMSDCYYQTDLSADSNGQTIPAIGECTWMTTEDLVDLVGVTAAQISSGELAYKLSCGWSGTVYGEQVSAKVWGQTLEGKYKQSYPVVNGERVYSWKQDQDCKCRSKGNIVDVYSNKNTPQEKYRIKDISVSDLKWNTPEEPFVYDGTQKSISLKLPEQLTAALSGNVATRAGICTATAIISVKSEYKDRYHLKDTPDNSAVITRQWTINKAEIPDNAPTDLTVENTVKTVEQAGKLIFTDDVTNSGWTPEASDGSLDEVKAKTIPAGGSVTLTAVYTGDDKDCYKTIRKQITITRKACEEDPKVLYTGDGEHAPTCTAAGTGHTECKLCGDTINTDVSVGKTPHILVMVPAKNATLQETGNIAYYKCQECDGYFSDEAGENEISDKTSVITPTQSPKPTVVPTTEPTGKPGETTQPAPGTSEVPTTEPTGKPGETAQPTQPAPGTSVAPTTEPTGKPSETPQTSPATSEKAAAKPQKVGSKLEGKNGVQYRVTSSKKNKKTVAYKLSKKSKKKSIVIPKSVTIAGVKYQVTSIDDNAFKDNTTINEITIGKQIKSIGKNAFDGCENLKKIIIKSEKLKAGNVGKNAFANGSDEVIVKTSKKKLEAYKKLLKKRGISRNASFES